MSSELAKYINVNTEYKPISTTGSKRVMTILCPVPVILIILFLQFGFLNFHQYLNKDHINYISTMINVHYNDIKNITTDTREPDIDYSIQKMLNTKMVNKIAVIEDTIANTSFIFYHSSMLGWVLADIGEQYVRRVFSTVLSNNINILPSSIMLDIGANMGYYGLLSLSKGIGNAIFFEPQPACVQIIQSLVSVNGFGGRSRIINHPIGSGELLEVPDTECDGRFPVNKKEGGKTDAYGNSNGVDDGENNENTAFVSFFTVEKALRDINDRNILITKIDTEGFELIILPLLFKKFEKHQLINVVVEITPNWWKYTNNSIEQGASILGQIIEFGYDATSVLETAINTKEQMIEFILNQSKKPIKQQQLDMWFHCIVC